jgi:hypothetical protein
MRARRLLVFGGVVIAGFVVGWSCSTNKRCSDQELEPYRRYPCAAGTGGSAGAVICDKSGTIVLGPLDPQAQQFVACCSCDTNGAPSCKTCDQMGY